MLQFLDKSLEHSEHTHHDFYAAELAGCLSRLAGHNSNKILVSFFRYSRFTRARGGFAFLSTCSLIGLIRLIVNILVQF